MCDKVLQRKATEAGNGLILVKLADGFDVFPFSPKTYVCFYSRIAIMRMLE